jgi:hypothetical protein
VGTQRPGQNGPICFEELVQVGPDMTARIGAIRDFGRCPVAKGSGYADASPGGFQEVRGYVQLRTESVPAYAYSAWRYKRIPGP